MASSTMENLATVLGYFTTTITSWVTTFLAVGTSYFNWLIANPLPFIVTAFGMVMAIMSYIKSKGYI